VMVIGSARRSGLLLTISENARFKVEAHLTVLQGMSKKIGRRYQSRLNILGCLALLHALRTRKPQIPSTIRRG
jgi:hypothetical protein